MAPPSATAPDRRRDLMQLAESEDLTLTFPKCGAPTENWPLSAL
jgi:hypothetical protein